MDSPWLLKMLKNTAGLTAAVFAATAASAAGVPIALLSLGYAAALLVGQSWIEAQSEKALEGVRDDLRTLLDKHENLSSLVEALAQTRETHPHIKAERAQEVHALLTASVGELAAIAADNTSLIKYSTEWLGKRQEEYGENFTRALESLGDYLQEEFDRLHERHDLTHAKLDELSARLDVFLADKQAAGSEAPREPSAEELAIAAQVRRLGAAKEKAKAALVQRDFAAFREHLAEAMKPALAEAFELLTLQGDGFYYEGRFDEAIGPYEKAYGIRPDDFTARNNLALALQRARRLPRAADIERAIELYRESLAGLAAGSERWAMTQHNLGAAWGSLPTGDRGENLKRAIACYEKALEVYTRPAHPVEWATTQNNLGAAWRSLPTGEKAENLERAIACYEKALEVRTRAAHPVDWAMTQNNLGVALCELPTGDRGENLGRAIACYERALEVRTRAAHPVDWAMTQNNLGNAWKNLPTGDWGENLKRAIACYKKALQVYTRPAHPVDWAMTQNNLGNLWSELPTGERDENLARAIACYENALEVYTRAAFPHYHEVVAGNLRRTREALDAGG